MTYVNQNYHFTTFSMMQSLEGLRGEYASLVVEKDEIINRAKII